MRKVLLLLVEGAWPSLTWPDPCAHRPGQQLTLQQKTQCCWVCLVQLGLQGPGKLKVVSTCLVNQQATAEHTNLRSCASRAQSYCHLANTFQPVCCLACSESARPGLGRNDSSSQHLDNGCMITMVCSIPKHTISWCQPSLALAAVVAAALAYLTHEMRWPCWHSHARAVSAA